MDGTSMAQEVYMDRPQAQAAKERAYPVSQEYGNLQKAIATVQESAQMLRERLDSVLTPPIPIGEDPGKNPERSVSKFALTIQSDVQSIYLVNRLLQDLMSRLEIAS